MCRYLPRQAQHRPNFEGRFEPEPILQHSSEVDRLVEKSRRQNRFRRDFRFPFDRISLFIPDAGIFVGGGRINRSVDLALKGCFYSGRLSLFFTFGTASVRFSRFHVDWTDLLITLVFNFLAAVFTKLCFLKVYLHVRFQGAFSH